MLLVLVPLTFTTSVYRIYSMPKFAVLVLLSAAILPLVAVISISLARRESLLHLKESKHALLVTLYFIIASIWQIFIKQTPDREAAEQARRQVYILSQKVNVNN